MTVQLAYQLTQRTRTVTMLLPLNEKNPAKVRIDKFIEAANRQYDNALNVQSVPFGVYKKIRGKGIECSCYKDHSPQEPNKKPHQVDPQNSVSSRSITVEAVSNPSRMAVIDTLPVPTVDAIDIGAIDYQNDGIFGGNTTNCGVCFGTGHIGGYKYLSGERLVLDVQSANISGGGIDDTLRPFSTYPNTTATWTIRRPQYFTKADIRAYNNDKLLTVVPVITELGLPVDLTALVLPPANLTGSQCTLTSSEPFTHVVITFDFMPRPQLEPSSVAYTKDILTENISGSMTVVPSPSLSLYPEDILVDTRNRVWEVESVDEQRSSTGIRVGSTVDCSVIQDWSVKRCLKDLPVRW